jgi:nucleoside-diphosphate-sugar epimerase
MSERAGVLIVGLGYVGHSLARALQERGREWVGLRRHAEGDPRVRPVDLDRGPPDLSDLPTGTVVYLAPPPKDSEGDPRLRHFLRHWRPARPSASSTRAPPVSTATRRAPW